MWICGLYVEGGEHDGENYCCGPFDEEYEAREAAAILDNYGSTQVLYLYPNASRVELDVAS